MMSDEAKEKIFSTIQQFLKYPPVIIWGSGATVPYGLPTMGDLNQALKNNIDDFNPTDENLEIELGKNEYQEQRSAIRKVIWNTVNEAEKAIIHKLISAETDGLNAIKSMIDKFREAHPKILNIVTTNYDRVLEYVMGYYSIPFSDGFIGREFSRFDEETFENKNIVNLIKVHGSLSWFDIGSDDIRSDDIRSDDIRHLLIENKTVEPVIISPGKSKYLEAYKSPYRELIQKSDALIKQAKSFLVVGFGFNDEHLTPKICQKIKAGTPLVLITKNITDSCFKKMKTAQRYILIEEGVTNTETSVSIKNNAVSEKQTLAGNFWKLQNFMEIL